MNVRESVGIALDALRANKLRSFLTLVGIIIGVASVIVVMSVVQGLNRYVREKLVSSGSNVFSVDRVGAELDFRKVGEKLRRRKLTTDDAAAIARAAPHVEAAIATRDAFAALHRGSVAMRGVQIHGVEPGYMDVEDFPLERGRALEDGDQTRRASVCVIGSQVAENLFGNSDPIGRDLRVGDVPMLIVGVGDRKGQAFGQDQDQYVILPLATFEKLYGHEGSVTLVVRSRGIDTFAQAQDEARAILRQRRHVPPAQPDDFELVTPEMLIGIWKTISGAIFAVIVGVSLISLLVGGIVIMNIMLVSVTERTREIGIRKALGARSGDVLAQFLIEAVTLALTGGLIGLGIGAVFSLLLGMLTPLPSYVSPMAVGLGIASSSAVGIFFGAYPASRAARLDPIQALRHE